MKAKFHGKAKGLTSGKEYPVAGVGETTVFVLDDGGKLRGLSHTEINGDDWELSHDASPKAPEPKDGAQARQGARQSAQAGTKGTEPADTSATTSAPPTEAEDTQK